MMDVRYYTKNDIDELVSLWVKVFGDSETFVRSFYEMLPQMGNCVVGQENGKVVAMASVFTDLEIISKDKRSKTAYIYAVAVDESCRGKGYGVEISRAAYNAAINSGAEIVTTLPSSDSLYSFYNSALRMKPELYRICYETYANSVEKINRIDSCRYADKRRQLLSGKTHLELGNATIEFYKNLCEEYGGGLFEGKSGICSAQVSDGICVIYEIISDAPDELAASVSNILGISKAQYYLPATVGSKFIMADENADIHSDCTYNIAFE